MIDTMVNDTTGVPISLFAVSGRLGNLANDEAVVAKAVRQNSQRIEVISKIHICPL
jgi:prolipoprotein diacylglyceryltransferase